MQITLTVRVEVERVTGKFASRDELTELLREELTGAEVSDLQTENDAEYQITSWEVE